MYIIRVEEDYAEDSTWPVIKKIMEDLGVRGTDEAPATALILLHNTWAYYSSPGYGPTGGTVYLNKEYFVNEQEETKSITVPLLQLRQAKLKTTIVDNNQPVLTLASENQERYVLNLVKRILIRDAILFFAYSLVLCCGLFITALILPPGWNLIMVPVLIILCALISFPSVFSADHCSLAGLFYEWMDPSIKLTWETLQNPPEVPELEMKDEVVKEKPTGCEAWFASFFSHKNQPVEETSEAILMLG